MEFYKRVSFGIKDDPLEHFLRSISGAMALNLSHTKITPNQITLFRIPITIVYLYLFTLGHFWGYLIASLLMIFNHILDYVDGDLARVTKKMSQIGEWLETLTDGPFSHIHTFTGFFLCIGIYKQSGIMEVWPVLFLSLLGAHLNDVFSKYSHFENKGDNTETITDGFQDEYDKYKQKYYFSNIVFIILRRSYLFVVFAAIFYYPIYEYTKIHPLFLGLIIIALTNQIMWISRVIIQYKYIFITKKMKI